MVRRRQGRKCLRRRGGDDAAKWFWRRARSRVGEITPPPGEEPAGCSRKLWKMRGHEESGRVEQRRERQAARRTGDEEDDESRRRRDLQPFRPRVGPRRARLGAGASRAPRRAVGDSRSRSPERVERRVAPHPAGFCAHPPGRGEKQIPFLASALTFGARRRCSSCSWC